MPAEFHWDRRVEFCETDAAGIAHFSSLILYMEQAEHALLRSLGYSVASSATSKHSNSPSSISLSWPRVHVECIFRSPARFEDMLTLRVSIATIGSKSVTFRHKIMMDEVCIAEGTMKSVCCNKSGSDLNSQEIPLEMKRSLEHFVIPPE
jgi:acyl-CoA thioester hydrolase